MALAAKRDPNQVEHAWWVEKFYQLQKKWEEIKKSLPESMSNWPEIARLLYNEIDKDVCGAPVRGEERLFMRGRWRRNPNPNNLDPNHAMMNKALGGGIRKSKKRRYTKRRYKKRRRYTKRRYTKRRSNKKKR